MEREQIVRGFLRHFSGTPRCFQAPGRVNLIGEHTDYNDGFVFPMALEFSTAVAVGPRRDRVVRLWSANMQEAFSFSLEDNEKRRHHWSDYVAGVARMLEGAGFRLPGADLYIESTVPVGSGLSSSAAIEVSSALAFLSTGGWSLEGRELARLAQRAENQFVGMNCGIMDQFISVHGRHDHALFLDCRSLDFRLVPLPSDRVRIVICNTMVRHELGSSEYNRRRAECEQGVALLQARFPGIRALRDVTPAQFEDAEAELPGVVRKRCRHVVREDQRVLDSVACLEGGEASPGHPPHVSPRGGRLAGDGLSRFGALLNASHDSLRDDYEVSCPELDLMVDIARGLAGCLGARLTGGGFGGCTVNLVEADRAAAFCRQIGEAYRDRTGIEPQVTLSVPGEGAHELLP
jgi:galactokinase